MFYIVFTYFLKTVLKINYKNILNILNIKIILTIYKKILKMGFQTYFYFIKHRKMVFKNCFQKKFLIIPKKFKLSQSYLMYFYLFNLFWQVVS